MYSTLRNTLSLKISFLLTASSQALLQKISKADDLKQWYLNYIDYFRKEYEKLPADEKKGVNSTNNFLNSCQIESFWLANPDYQLMVLSNFSDRSDKEIIINGPYEPSEFYSKIIPILKEERWMRKVKENLPREYEQFDTFGERMALEIHRFVETSKICTFKPERSIRELLRMEIEDTWIHLYAGNVGELDHVQEINQLIHAIKQNAKFEQRQETRIGSTDAIFRYQSNWIWSVYVSPNHNRFGAQA